MRGARCTWLSTHLHFAGDIYAEVADRVVLEVVAPVAGLCLARGWARRFFFIRYNEGGSHVRLRLQCHPEELARRVRPLILERAAAPGLVDRVEWVAYEPELGRYGGREGVALAERLFHGSSRAALALLRGLSPGDRSERLGRALLATLALLHAFCGGADLAAVLIRAYGERYLAQREPEERRRDAWARAFERGRERQAAALAPRIEAAWEALEARDGLPPAIAAWDESLRDAATRFADLVETGRLAGPEGEPLRDRRLAVGLIAPSYLHMTNNRLGVSVHEEIYLSALIAPALARLAGPDLDAPGAAAAPIALAGGAR